MANLDEILKRSQEKLKDKALQTKKVKRDSHSRPWREDGLEFGNSKVETKLEASTSMAGPTPNAHIASPLELTAPPTQHIHNSKLDDSRGSESFRNKSVTNAKQFRNNDNIDYVTINKQTSNNSVTNDNELSSDLNSFRNNSVTESATHSVTNAKQFRNKTSAAGTQNFNLNRLSGHRLKIVQTIFELCQERGAMNTGPISRSVFEARTGINGEVIRVTNSRLTKEGFIVPLESKPGNGGFTVFELNQKIYGELLNTYLRGHSVTNAKQFRNNSVTESATHSVTTAPSKIVSNYNNTNYLTEEENSKEIQTSSAQNLGWFKSLDFSAILYIKPMMVNSAIRTLVESKLDPDDLQMFINKFKNWLATQSKIQNPLAIFCDKLKEYANEGDSPVLSVMSDEELQVEFLMAQDLEKKRAEMDLINKARAFKQEQEKEALFQEWFTQSTEEEKRSIYPETPFAKFGTDIYIISLKEAYLSQTLG